MRKYDKTGNLLIFIFSLLFYLFWYMQDGVIMTNDAQSYIDMQSDREPGYCVFLAVLRLFFGGQRSLHAAVIIQCIAAALAACALVKALRELFNLKLIESAAVLIIQYGITLLNKFAALRHYSYYNSIETEGLAYSLWIFFFICILEVLYRENGGRKKGIVKALIWSILLISIRKQMLITLIILGIAIIYAYCADEKRNGESRGISKHIFEALAVSAAAALAGFFASQLIDCAYNFALRGEFGRHSGDSSFILGTQLYLADAEMAESIEDDALQTLFLEIMARADENEYNIRYAGKGWQNIEEHYSLAYDNIKFGIMMPVIRGYIEEAGIGQDGWQKPYNELAGEMMKSLLLPCMPRLVKLFSCNFIHGLVTTVLKTHRLLNLIAAVIYALYAALIFALIYLAKRGDAFDEGTRPCACAFAVMVLAAIAINDAFTSVAIYPQMRYMLYNTGLFYQSGVVMLAELIKRYGGLKHGGAYERTVKNP